MSRDHLLNGSWLEYNPFLIRMFLVILKLVGRVAISPHASFTLADRMFSRECGAAVVGETGF